MIDISQIFQNTAGGLNDEQLQFFTSSLRDNPNIINEFLGYLNSQETPSYEQGGYIPMYADGETVPPDEFIVGYDKDGKPLQVTRDSNSKAFYGPYDPQRVPQGYQPGDVLDQSYMKGAENPAPFSSGPSIPRTNSGFVPSEEELTPLKQNMRGVIIDGQEYNQSGEPIVQRPPIAPYVAPPAPPKIDNGGDYSSYGSFGKAFSAARQELGKGQSFVWNGKRYTTNTSEDVNTTRDNTSKPITNKVESPKGKGNISQKKSTTNPIEEEGVQKTNERSKEISDQRKLIDIEKQKYEIAKLKNDYDRAQAEEDLKAYNKLSWFTGPLTPKQRKEREIIKQKGEIAKMKIYKNYDPNKFFQTLVRKEDGGNIPMFVGGGKTKQINDPNNPGKIITVDVDDPKYEFIPPIQSKQQLDMMSTLGISVPEEKYDKIENEVWNPVTNQFELRENTGNLTLLSNTSGNTGVDKDGRAFSISTDNPNGYVTNDVASALNSDASYNHRIQQNLNQQDARMNMLNTLTSNTDYSMEDALYKAGESLSYNPSDDVFKNAQGEVNSTAKGISQAANTVRLIGSVGKALFAGARNVAAGAAAQKRNDLVLNEYRRKQMNALKNQQLRFENGGDFPFFNDGGYLMYLEDGDGQIYSDMGAQDQREQMPLPKEMTGEYLQQQPMEANIQPNAEVEHKEYVQHPDGQVQQVEGRKHESGGERVALEPGTNIISDNLKLGARNAKVLNNEYNLNLKAGDTYATAINKYTKKIGIKDLNDQQEEYFNKLKKDAKTRNEDASELNNQFLSEKINGIEQKKALLENLRSSFTDHVYSLQQESKTPRTTEVDSKKKELPTSEEITRAMQMAEESSEPVDNPQEETQEAPMMEDGGQLPMFDLGGEIKAIMDSMGVPEDSIEGQKFLSRIIQRYKKGEDFTAESLYNAITGIIPEAGYKSYEEFKNSKAIDRMFGGNNPFESIENSYIKKTEPLKTPSSNSSKPNERTFVKNSGKPLNSNDYINTHLKEAKSDPEFDYGNLTEQEKWWGYLGDLYGMDLSKYDLKTQKGQDALAKDMQDAASNKFSKTIQHFSLNVPPTQLGLQAALDNNLITETRLKELGVKVNKGKILKGSMDGVSKANVKTLTSEIKTNGEKNPEGLKAYVGTNFNDGMAYYRFPEINNVEFDNQEAVDKAIKDNGFEEVEDVNGNKVYFSKKDGQYFIPTIKSSTDEPPKKTDPNNEQTAFNKFSAPRPKTYKRPMLPDMSLEPPRPMDAHMKAEHRYDTIDPTLLNPDRQLSEIYRSNNAAAAQLDGLTDTQRASALMNLTANTQNVAANSIAGIEAQNAQELARVQQYNNQIMNHEEDQRVADALDYEKRQFIAKTLTDQDRDDFFEKNREIRIKRFNYLHKDKMINSMIENFDNNGDFQAYASNMLQLGYPMDYIQKSWDDKQKTIKTNQTKADNKGNVSTTSTVSTVSQPNKLGK